MSRRARTEGDGEARGDGASKRRRTEPAETTEPGEPGESDEAPAYSHTEPACVSISRAICAAGPHLSTVPAGVLAIMAAYAAPAFSTHTGYGVIRDNNMRVLRTDGECPVPRPVRFPVDFRSHDRFAHSDGCIYLSGHGSDGRPLAARYAPLTDTWSRREPMPLPRRWPLLECGSGHILYTLPCTGNDSRAGYYAVAIYSTVHDAWTPVPAEAPGNLMRVSVCDAEPIFVASDSSDAPASGSASGSVGTVYWLNLSSAYRDSVALDVDHAAGTYTWRVLPRAPGHFSRIDAVCARDGVIEVVGHSNGARLELTYMPATNTWARTPAA